jgi:hypothetical protein
MEITPEVEKKIDDAVEKAVDKTTEKGVEIANDPANHAKAKNIFMRLWAWIKLTFEILVIE